MKPEKHIRIVVARPGEPAEILSVADDLKTFQSLVGGHIEILRLPELPEWTHCYANEDGLGLGLPANLHVAGHALPIVGPILVSAGDRWGNEKGLGPEQAVHAAAVLDRLRGIGP